MGSKLWMRRSLWFSLAHFRDNVLLTCNLPQVSKPHQCSRFVMFCQTSRICGSYAHALMRALWHVRGCACPRTGCVHGAGVGGKHRQCPPCSVVG